MDPVGLADSVGLADGSMDKDGLAVSVVGRTDTVGVALGCSLGIPSANALGMLDGSILLGDDVGLSVVGKLVGLSVLGVLVGITDVGLELGLLVGPDVGLVEVG